VRDDCVQHLDVHLGHRFLFLSIHPAPPPLSTLSLHDALPISSESRGSVPELRERCAGDAHGQTAGTLRARRGRLPETSRLRLLTDRKSTRLNSSHVAISYAVFCLKKKKQRRTTMPSIT